MPLPLAELEDRRPKARRRPGLTAALAVACAAGAAVWPSDRGWLLLAAAGMAAYPRESRPWTSTGATRPSSS